nr:hypothetical protein [Tanacetum cinerariifolium]
DTTRLNEIIIQLVLSTNNDVDVNYVESVSDDYDYAGQVIPVHHLDPMLDRIFVLCKNLSQIQYTRSYWPGDDTFAAERLDHEKTSFTSELNELMTRVAVDNRKCSSQRRLRSQAVSATALATPRYSASALEREIVCWRIEDQDRRATTHLNEIIIQLVPSNNNDVDVNCVESVFDDYDYAGQVAPVHNLDPMLDRISVLCENLSQIQYTRSYWPGDDMFAAERLDHQKTSFTSELNELMVHLQLAADDEDR